MADNFDSTLLCDESKDLCFDKLDDNNDDDDHDQSRPWANGVEPGPLILFPLQNEGDFSTLVEKEIDFLPKHDYLSRLRCRNTDLCARREAFDWIWKAHTYYSFGPLSLCLAVSYLDRFLSICDLPGENSWAVQLLAVACLSIAAKMEETTVPQSIELQVGDPDYVFEAKTIQRMELLVLDTLNWKMNAITPCSFMEYSLKKLCEALESSSFVTSSVKVMNRSMELILCTTRGIDFLEFKPSEIAVAVAISVVVETQAVDIDKAISCFIHLKKDRVLRCAEMIKDLALNDKGAKAVPQSPSRVLDSAGFSYKSDELTTIGSVTTTTSISCSPETKRKKLSTSSTSEL